MKTVLSAAYKESSTGTPTSAQIKNIWYVLYKNQSHFHQLIHSYLQNKQKTLLSDAQLCYGTITYIGAYLEGKFILQHLESTTSTASPPLVFALTVLYRPST